MAAKEGRKNAMKIAKKIDPVFSPRNLNPDDAKVIFHPIDYIVFKGMNPDRAIKKVILLDRTARSRDHRAVQRSVERAVSKERYEWQTIRVKEDGSVKSE